MNRIFKPPSSISEGFLSLDQEKCQFHFLLDEKSTLDAFDDLFIGPNSTAPDLRNQIHREFVNRPFQFHKRSQLFICAHDETVSVAMRVNDPDRLPLKIDG